MLQALELEPGSTFYQTSLAQVEEKLNESQRGTGNARPAAGGKSGTGIHFKEKWFITVLLAWWDNDILLLTPYESPWNSFSL